MARVRSRSHPVVPLADSLDHIKAVHEKDRQHPVARDTAARHMGFSGQTGSSDRALAAVMHYGLAEKAAKGEIRVSDLAINILYGDDAAERRAALREAAFNPDLFRELRDRYPGSPPSQAALGSFLAKLNFAPAAIAPASRAYLETCYFLQREDAYESDARNIEDRREQGSLSKPEEAPAMQTPAIQQPPAPPPPPALTSSGELVLNKPNLNIRGDVVHIEALLDADGLDRLEAHIKALRLILPKPETI